MKSPFLVSFFFLLFFFLLLRGFLEGTLLSYFYLVSQSLGPSKTKNLHLEAHKPEMTWIVAPKLSTLYSSEYIPLHGKGTIWMWLRWKSWYEEFSLGYPGGQNAITRTLRRGKQRSDLDKDETMEACLPWTVSRRLKRQWNEFSPRASKRSLANSLISAHWDWFQTSEF